jgi:hypothetical protein
VPVGPDRQWKKKNQARAVGGNVLGRLRGSWAEIGRIRPRRSENLFFSFFYDFFFKLSTPISNSNTIQLLNFKHHSNVSPNPNFMFNIIYIIIIIIIYLPLTI